MSDFTPEWIIVHCTATPPDLDADAAWVARVHRAKGWSGCGYHEVITRFNPQRQNRATGFPTRPMNRPGIHVGGCGRGWNNICIGISLAGGVDNKGQPEDNFTEAQRRLLLEAIREYQALYGISDEKVIGHRDLIKMTNASPKACPCFSVREFLKGSRHGGAFNFARKMDPADKMGIPSTHKLRRGESLWGVSKAYGVSLEDLIAWNDIIDPAHVRAGATLELRPRG